MESERGKGTRFKVYFPVCGTGTRPIETSDEVCVVEKGDEHILLVDDDEKVAVMHTKMLEKMGYTVTCFTDSSAALDACMKSPDAFDAAITDLTMPDLDGIGLACRLYEIRPDLPVILCTGLAKPSANRRTIPAPSKGI